MQLLLPYALDTTGKLIHIDDAHKSEKYICPTCNAELVLKIGRIPEGQKYHRRNHFAHKCNSDNHCSESFLHKYFKERCVEVINKFILSQKDLFFVWRCKKCTGQHRTNLLENVSKVELEYDLKVCRPDIALLDSNDKLIVVIEIIVTHNPEPKVMQYYEDNNIICLLVNINDFQDCENIQSKLSHPTETLLPISSCNVKLKPSKPNYTLRSRPQTTLQSYSNNNAYFIRLLKERGNKICPKCKAALQIKQKWDKTPFLGCTNAPKCEYTQSLDSVIWPDKFK